MSRCHFADPVTFTELSNAAKGVIPAKTEASTEWAVRNYECWAHNCFSSSSGIVPRYLLCSHNALSGCAVL